MMADAIITFTIVVISLQSIVIVSILTNFNPMPLGMFGISY